MNVALIGCGRLGTNLGFQLSKSGYNLIGLASKTIESARNLGEKTGVDKISSDAINITKNADLIFICTPDDIIEKLCKKISQNNGFKNNSVVIHLSGSLPSTILESARKSGSKIASMHPLQSFADTSCEHNLFEDIYVSVEGDKDAVQVASKVGLDLGAHVIKIKTQAKTLYHAAAVVASNYLVTIQFLAQELNKIAGISSTDSFKSLKPLINGTLANIEQLGIPDALTGPIVRGDVEIIEKHIQKIEENNPDLSDLYKILGKYTNIIAELKGGRTMEVSEKIKSLLNTNG